MEVIVMEVLKGSWLISRLHGRGQNLSFEE